MEDTLVSHTIKFVRIMKDIFKCTRCYAIILEEDISKHGEWHDNHVTTT